MVALAGSWPPHREALVIEADRSGGDLVARFASFGDDTGGVRAEPSTVQLAVGARGGLSERVLLEHLQRLPGSGEVRALGEVVLVARPRVTSVVHTRDLAASLRHLGVRVSLLLVGDSPYSPAEVGDAVGGLVVIGVLADDPAGAAALDGTARTPKVWARSRLVRSAAAVADRLAADPAPPEAPAAPAHVILPGPSPLEFSGVGR